MRSGSFAVPSLAYCCQDKDKRWVGPALGLLLEILHYFVKDLLSRRGGGQTLRHPLSDAIKVNVSTYHLHIPNAHTIVEGVRASAFFT
jgi:hypothetical protein